MLKFQNNHTTLRATFEDFILLVYTIVDNLYQQYVPTFVSQRENVDIAKMSDSKSLPWASAVSLSGWIPKMPGIPL